MEDGWFALGALSGERLFQKYRIFWVLFDIFFPEVVREDACYWPAQGGALPRNGPSLSATCGRQRLTGSAGGLPRHVTYESRRSIKGSKVVRTILQHAFNQLSRIEHRVSRDNKITCAFTSHNLLDRSFSRFKSAYFCHFILINDKVQMVCNRPYFISNTELIP